MKLSGFLGLLCSLALLNTVSSQVIYTDDFSSGAGWTVLGSNTDGNSDFESEFGFDVSTRGIANSPNGDNIVLRLAANIAAPTGREAVSAFLTSQTINLDFYQIQVDVYCAFEPPRGGTGTTRYAGIGIEHDTTPLGPVHLRTSGSDAGPYTSTDGGAGQDGLVFSYNTDEDDAAGAFYLLEGDTVDPEAALTAVGTWADPDNTAPTGQLQANDYWQGIIPANPDDGNPTDLELMGNQWVTVTITKQGSRVGVSMFGEEVVVHNFSNDPASGESILSLTNERPFSSVTPSPTLSECYYDNLVITELAAPSASTNWVSFE
jgi:hypothetical protein